METSLSVNDSFKNSKNESHRDSFKIPPHRNIGVWNKDEHHKFLVAVLLYNRDWKKISKFVGTRNITQVKTHARSHLKYEQHILDTANILVSFSHSFTF